MASDRLIIGFDVGSTTVKAVVVAADTRDILWSDYQRHGTRQAQMALAFLERMQSDLGPLDERARVFVTGSGGAAIARRIGAKLVQEVNAVSLAVERDHPDVGSIIELGGQDAKIIIWQVDPKSGAKRKQPSMNDKCAGGTGAVIDKVAAKLKLSTSDIASLPYRGVKLHPVAGKCGVFAETDINGLQKLGVPSPELMASLYAAIVQQNLSVLTRGNTLRPKVMLLGGPNTFIPALQDAWKIEIPKLWAERGIDLGDVDDPEQLIFVPDKAEYYAAMGAILYGAEEPETVGVYGGADELRAYVDGDRLAEAGTDVDPGLVDADSDREAFADAYAIPSVELPRFSEGRHVQAWLGLDGGSTSTKGVLIDGDGEVIARQYTLSHGNPIHDAKQIIAALVADIERDGAVLDLAGFGTTGYAKDVLKDTLSADVALVETVAHTQSALHYHRDVDVIVDVGGQDIKVIFLKDGVVSDFKLNTQCSAGNGYFLQSTAARFGVAVEDFADAAFRARRAPIFSYGCAVFMESDIVNFQRQGWQADEIMAGLAKVLPKNIWLYVVQEPNLKKYGTRFLLQGGTQRNLAAVKAQVDYIEARVPGAHVEVHRYCGESGAIGAALEAQRISRGASSFIGFGDLETLTFEARRDESTRCSFCANHCLRTFIDSETAQGRQSRFIVATCEKGTVTDEKESKQIARRIAQRAKENPNLVAYAAKRAFKTSKPEVVAPAAAAVASGGKRSRLASLNPRGHLLRTAVRRFIERKANPKKTATETSSTPDVLERRRKMVVGMPRVLNMYSMGPFFRAYFEALGVGRIVWSEPTSEELWKEGGKRGSIDACFPSKVAVAHVHNLLYPRKDHQKIDLLFFPTLITLPDPLVNTIDSCACPTVQSTPNVCKAAFTKESDLFAERGVAYVDPALHFTEPSFVRQQLFEALVEPLGLTQTENDLAIDEAWKAQEAYRLDMVERGRTILTQLEREHRVGVLMIGRPYHNDPGLNHGVVEELQNRGYPILTMDSLPDSDVELRRVFGADLEAGRITDPKDIRDVFGNPYSTNSSLKIWAAKYAARHPNLAVLDLSSFRCGHDAPIYHVIEGVLAATQTPYFTLHDIDENKPTGSIKIRIETLAYTLARYEEALAANGAEDRATGSVVFPLALNTPPPAARSTGALVQLGGLRRDAHG